jgi:2',3'-cyclic-nucleotide 2'-phosphodiesterase
MKREARALMIGDVVGQGGLRALFLGLPSLLKRVKADIVVVNGENAAGGFGLQPEIAEQIFAAGANVITSGNHIWQKREIYPMLERMGPLLRPANYPTGAPGTGSFVVEAGGLKWAVVNLQGRRELPPINCPFKAGQDLVKRLRHETRLILVDFHAESSDEKEALALSLDGEVSAFAGTHTHVQTADERILPKGTGYLTDLGMTGVGDSVIGVKTEICVRRSLLQMPIKMEAAEGDAAIMGALFTIDAESGKCLKVERIRA